MLKGGWKGNCAGARMRWRMQVRDQVDPWVVSSKWRPWRQRNHRRGGQTLKSSSAYGYLMSLCGPDEVLDTRNAQPMQRSKRLTKHVCIADRMGLCSTQPAREIITSMTDCDQRQAIHIQPYAKHHDTPARLSFLAGTDCFGFFGTAFRRGSESVAYRNELFHRWPARTTWNSVVSPSLSLPIPIQ